MVDVQPEPFWAASSTCSVVKEACENFPAYKASDIMEAIPKFKKVVKGNVLVEYTTIDDVLNYHIYRADRKKLFDEALEAMRGADDKTSLAIASKANELLEALPWWPDTEKVLRAVFAEHFRDAPLKVSHYPEVDSWSVVMLEPSFLGAKNASFLEAVVAKLALRFGS